MFQDYYPGGQVGAYKTSPMTTVMHSPGAGEFRSHIARACRVARPGGDCWRTLVPLRPIYDTCIPGNDHQSPVDTAGVEPARSMVS